MCIRKQVSLLIERKFWESFLKNFFVLSPEIEYHHAFTQTGPTMDQIQKVKEVKCSRDTQTIEFRQISMVMSLFNILKINSIRGRSLMTVINELFSK